MQIKPNNCRAFNRNKFIIRDQNTSGVLIQIRLNNYRVSTSK